MRIYATVFSCLCLSICSADKPTHCALAPGTDKPGAGHYAKYDEAG